MPNRLLADLATYLHDGDYLAAYTALPSKLVASGLWPVPSIPCINALSALLDDLLYLGELASRGEDLPDTGVFENYSVPLLVGLQTLVDECYRNPFLFDAKEALRDSDAMDVYFASGSCDIYNPSDWMECYSRPRWFFSPRSAITFTLPDKEPIATFFRLSDALEWSKHHPQATPQRVALPAPAKNVACVTCCVLTKID